MKQKEISVEEAYTEADMVLEREKDTLQKKRQEADAGIEQLRLDENHPLIAMYEPGRQKLLAEINTLTGEIDRLHKLGNGELGEGSVPKGPELKKGQYRPAKSLSQAVLAYLLYTPNYGPVSVPKLVEALGFAGTSVPVRKGKDKGKRNPIEARHIRIMAADYKTGYESKGNCSPFIYDNKRDEITLRVPDEHQHEA